MGVNRIDMSGAQVTPLATQMGQPGAIGNLGLQAAPAPAIGISSPAPAVLPELGR